MKVVVEIYDKEYEEIMYTKQVSPRDLTWGESLVALGTPLPKSHGDLKDANEIKEFYRKKLVSNLVDEARGLDWSEYAELPCKVFNEVIDDAPTVVEASDNIDDMLEELWNDYDKEVKDEDSD